MVNGMFSQSKCYSELKQKCCNSHNVEKKSYHIASLIPIKGKKRFEQQLGDWIESSVF